MQKETDDPPEMHAHIDRIPLSMTCSLLLIRWPQLVSLKMFDRELNLSWVANRVIAEPNRTLCALLTFDAGYRKASMRHGKAYLLYNATGGHGKESGCSEDRLRTSRI